MPMFEGNGSAASKARLQERPLGADYFQSLAYWLLGAFLLAQVAIIIVLR